MEPFDPLVEMHALANDILCMRIEPPDHAGKGGPFFGKPTVLAHLGFAQFAIQKRALVEQPGEQMHQAGGRAQSFDREGDLGRFVEIDRPRTAARIERRPRFVRQHERILIDIFDDLAPGARGNRHACEVRVRCGDFHRFDRSVPELDAGPFRAMSGKAAIRR